MYCEKCGRSIPDQARFCLQCTAGQYSVKPSVGLGEATSLFFSNYTNFKGRARRSEFWKGNLSINLITFLLGIVSALIQMPFLVSIWALVIYLPSLSLTVRRLHDVDKSGWWILINCIPLIGSILMFCWLCTDSCEDNKWGRNPKLIPNIPFTRNENVPKPAPAIAPAAVSTDDYPETAYSPPPTFYATPAPVPAPKPSFTITLVVCTGSMAGQQLTFPAGKTFTMGRSANRNDVALEQYNKVSGMHCRVAVGNQQMTVTDLNSTNGTFVNGKRLTPNQPVPVMNGSTIFLADSGCAFQVRFN